MRAGQIGTSAGREWAPLGTFAEPSEGLGVGLHGPPADQEAAGEFVVGRDVVVVRRVVVQEECANPFAVGAGFWDGEGGGPN